MRHELTIPDFTPTPLNRLMRGTLKQRMRLMRGDRDVIAHYARQQQVPLAGGKRRVSLLVTLTGRQQEPDVDSPWKSLLDSLVSCKLLRGDRVADAQLGETIYQRGAKRQTVIVLDDL